MSEPTLIDLPVGLRWIKLVCRLGRLVTDSTADTDAYPDLLSESGTLTLSASPSRVRIQEADGRWRSVEVVGRRYSIRDDGELVDNEGRVGVYIPDPSSTLVEPQNYTITAAVKPTGSAEWRVTVSGSDILPDVVDLVAVSSVGTASPSVTASFDARLYALEQGVGGGTGSGIELVSGTVTLGSSGTPIREFYCTATATIGGVSFAAGTTVVFHRALGGQWGYIVVDGWTPVGTTPEPDPDPELITVTATPPTWTDDTAQGGGSWTTPTITGVTYSPASGSAMPGQSVTVTATAQAGYVLSGTSTWTHTFPAEPVVGTIVLEDTFNRADGNLIGTSVDIGSAVWAVDPGNAMQVGSSPASPLITDGAVTNPDGIDCAALISFTPPAAFEASIDMEANSIRNTRAALFGYLFNVKSATVQAYTPGISSIGSVGNTAGTVRKIRLVWDGTTAGLYADDTLIGVSTDAPTDLIGISMQSSAVVARADNLRVVVP